MGHRPAGGGAEARLRALSSSGHPLPFEVMTPLFGGLSDDVVREAAWVARCVGRADTVPLSNSDLQALASYMARREIERGAVMFAQKKPQTGIWIVRSGRVELAIGSGRNRAVVFLLRPGDIEGDIALLLGKASPYTARAIADSVCLFIDGASFDRLLLDHPAIARRWLSSAAARLDRSQARILELLGRSLPQQVARLLLDEHEDGCIHLPQRTLAAMLGVHRPSLNKVLKDLEGTGMVALAYGEVTLRDLSGLERMASGRST